MEITINSEIRTLHLVTPMSLQKRAAPPPAGQPAAKFLKGSTKGSGKGGKSKFHSGPKKLEKLASTPHGQQICFAYNAEGCSNPKCQRAHVCRYCLKAHPMSECSLRPAVSNASTGSGSTGAGGTNEAALAADSVQTSAVGKGECVERLDNFVSGATDFLFDSFDNFASFGEAELGGAGPRSCEEAWGEHETSSEDEDGCKRARAEDHLGGVGPPLNIGWPTFRPLCDGSGLCSSGRWLPRSRRKRGRRATEMADELWRALADEVVDVSRLALELAVGKHGDKDPFPEKAVERARKVMANSLHVNADPTVGQPFCLELLSATLRELGDPDWRIFGDSANYSYQKGVPMGDQSTVLPRTPAVFERKRKRRKMDPMGLVWEMPNYKSALGKESEMEEQFKVEERDGMMFRLSRADAAREYGDRLRIAAQGAILKDDGSIRVVHDGTHGVELNQHIVVRDQLAVPRPEDLRAVLLLASGMPGATVALKADVSKAHRRVKLRSQDWGLLGCRSGADEGDKIWFHRVGTFGISSAAYWWGRLCAALGRVALSLLPEEKWLFQLVYLDDILLLAKGNEKLQDLAFVLFIWRVLGTPFSWRKVKGGLVVDWIGYELKLGVIPHTVGLSRGRADWAVKWCLEVGMAETVDMREFASGLGRLGFASSLLDWCKPLLGPLCAWSAATSMCSSLRVPSL
eukprot:6480156-Amphidinium_carterae.1